jgi:hypothetical protein
LKTARRPRTSLSPDREDELGAATSGGATLAVYGFAGVSSIVGVVAVISVRCQAADMPPVALALIDSVLALALHHDERARKNLEPDYVTGSVHAEIGGPTQGGPAPGGLAIRIRVAKVRRNEARDVEQREISVLLDLDEGRMLAPDLALAELPMDRSGLARLIGELEGWCYAQLPLYASEQG